MTSTVQAITLAIQALSSPERAELALALPALVPELERDSGWAQIQSDARPRPELTALLDAVEREFATRPESFPVVRDQDFASAQ